MDLIIGSHVSCTSLEGLYGSAKEAVSYGANTFMIYTGPNQSSSRVPINKQFVLKAHLYMKENNIDINNVIVHAPFIINLANNKDERKYNFYISFLKEEINRCQQLGINKLVLHPGSATDIDRKVALDNVVFGINKALENVDDFYLCIEYMSGKGSELCSNIEELSYIIKNTSVYVCLDTCHMNDSGINLNKFDLFMEEFESKIGIEKIKCIHINDSKNEIRSHKDRHENIGYGTIGFDNLINIIYYPAFRNIPKILETPYIGEMAPYKEEITMIRNKNFSSLLNK